MPILGQKQCFLGSGGQFKAPAPYFAGSRLKKTYVAGYGSRKMGDSAPPPPQNGHFLPKKRPKNANFGPKTILFGLGCPFQGPPPYFADARLKKTCVAGYGSRKMGDSGLPPPQKKWPFFAQEKPKNANFGPKTVFFGLGWPVQGPPSLFRRCSTQKKMCCRVRDPENR